VDLGPYFSKVSDFIGFVAAKEDVSVIKQRFDSYKYFVKGF